MKKMMYYNMRVQTAQRKLREARLSLLERKNTMLEPPEESLRKINHCLKSVGTIHGTSLLPHVIELL